MIDLTRLSPAPWEPKLQGHWQPDREWCNSAGPDIEGSSANDLEVLARLRSDAEFIALARNAFAVAMRRQWSPVYRGYENWAVWHAPSNESVCDGHGFGRDPFTALVEADVWYRQNVEKQP